MSGLNYLLILSDLGFDYNDDVEILHGYRCLQVVSYNSRSSIPTPIFHV